MKIESLENKSSSAHVAVKADNLIRKMYRHIEAENCAHCKKILNGDNDDQD